jgi:hypothetical protein
MEYIETKTKMEKVINSCNTVHQLMNAKTYCELLIGSYNKRAGKIALLYKLELMIQNKEYS